jgi:hypothetical protein
LCDEIDGVQNIFGMTDSHGVRASGQCSLFKQEETTWSKTLTPTTVGSPQTFINRFKLEALGLSMRTVSSPGVKLALRRL